MAEIKGGGNWSKTLDGIAARATNAQEVQVGFLENARYPDGTLVALVAAVNEYGKPPSQPPRPFFRGMISQHSSEWGPQAANILKSHDYNANATLSDMGELIKGELQQSIVDLTSPPIKPSTVAAKGSDKPLVDTGVMLRSVDYVVKDKA